MRTTTQRYSRPKVRETFCYLICPFSLHGWQDVVAGGRRSGRPWLGLDLVQVVRASPGFFRQFFTIVWTRETVWHLTYP